LFHLPIFIVGNESTIIEHKTDHTQQRASNF